MKAKIQETQGDDFPATSMNIIYQGKVRGRSWPPCSSSPQRLPMCSNAPLARCPTAPAHPCLAFLPNHVEQILKDDATLTEAGVTEAGFCVVMIMKVGG